MKRYHQRGITLVEMLVTMAGMAVLSGVVYETLHRSLLLQTRLTQDSTRLMDRCTLAERLTADLRTATQVDRSSTNSFRLTPTDGAPVEYILAGDFVHRSPPGNSPPTGQRFHVGPVTVAFWDQDTKSWNELPATNELRALRLRFTDSALIITRRAP